MTELNGFVTELSSANMDVKYHELWSHSRTLSERWIKFEKNMKPLLRFKLVLSQFEFKIFTYSYYLNRLRLDNMEKFKSFLKVCIYQLLQEMDEMELQAEESNTFKLPGYFHRDKQYLLEKFQHFMEDIEAFTNEEIFPKYTQTSILERPLEHAQDLFFGIQSAKEHCGFLAEYRDILNSFNERYKNTPGIKSQEEKERQALKFSNIPDGMAVMDLDGIDGYLFGSNTAQIETLLGAPDENPKYSGSIEEYLCYKRIGISLGFKNNSLEVINIYSGRPEGWGGTNYQKYNFRTNMPFTMDSDYAAILKLYGPPVDEKQFLKAKIPCKTLDYGRFSFHFNVSTSQIFSFQYKSKGFK